MTWQFWMLQMHYYAIMLFLLVHLCWCLSRSLVFTIPFARMAKNALVVWPVAKMKMNFTSWRFFVRAVVRRIFQNWKFCASLRTHDNSLNVFAYRIYDFFLVTCNPLCRIGMPVYMQDQHKKSLASQTRNATVQAGIWFVICEFVDCKLQIASPCAIASIVDMDVYGPVGSHVF